MTTETLWKRDALFTGLAIVVGATAFALQRPVAVLDAVDGINYSLGRLIGLLMPHPVASLAGSVFQVAVPIFVAFYLMLVLRQHGGAGLAFAWAGAAAGDVATHAAAAGSGSVSRSLGSQDWLDVLGADGLERAAGLGVAIQTVGLLLVAAGVVVAAAATRRAWADWSTRIVLDASQRVDTADPWLAVSGDDLVVVLPGGGEQDDRSNGDQHDRPQATDIDAPPVERVSQEGDTEDHEDDAGHERPWMPDHSRTSTLPIPTETVRR